MRYYIIIWGKRDYGHDTTSLFGNTACLRIFFSNSSGADTTNVFQEATDTKEKPAFQKVYISSGMVRIENDSGDGNYIIYKSETNG